jgi:superoxide reductase
MAERLQVYKCEICGNIVEVLHGGQGELVCCGKPMNLMKDVPVVEAGDKGVTVKVGSVPHPMEDKHYIEWVQIISGDNAYRIFLKPGGAPEGTFQVLKGKIGARESCNVHGLWRS